MYGENGTTTAVRYRQYLADSHGKGRYKMTSEKRRHCVSCYRHSFVASCSIENLSMKAQAGSRWAIDAKYPAKYFQDVPEACPYLYPGSTL